MESGILLHLIPVLLLQYTHEPTQPRESITHGSSLF